MFVSNLSRVARVFWRFLLLTLLAWVGGCQPAPAPSSTQPMADSLAVRVMSFNIRYGTADDGPNQWEQRRDLLIDLLRRYDADFVGMQEAMAFQVDEVGEALPQYASLGRTREAQAGEGEGVPILYKKARWRPDTSTTFWFSDTPQQPASKGWGNDIPRITTWARFVEQGTGRALYLYNTHFDHQSQPSRERSAQMLADHLSRRAHADPFVLTGDFNAGETNPAIQTLKQGPLALRDAYRVRHPDAQTVGTFNSWTGDSTGDKIDYVFVPPGVAVTAAGIVRDQEGGRYPSDHFPVWADVVVAPPASREEAP